MTKHHENRPETPLPMWQVFSVFMVQVAEAMNVNVLFPFLAFMIEDMGHGGHELGYYAGGLAAAFCGAQFSSSVAWGMISDNYGRKPAVFLGTLGTAIGMLVFGTAKTYWQAVLGRIIGGILCGNLGVVKSFLSEITDETNQGKGFSYLSIAWSIGSLLAPLAGGLLCSPADKYPKYFSKDGLFGYYPYLLPCLICVTCNVFSAFFCLFVMTETRKFKKDSSDKTGSKGLQAKKSNQSPVKGETKNPFLPSGDIEMIATTSSSTTVTGQSLEDDEELTKRRGLSRSAEEAAKFSILNHEDDEEENGDFDDEDSKENTALQHDYPVGHRVLHLEVDSTASPRSPMHHHHVEDARSMFLASDINYSEVAIGEEDTDEDDTDDTPDKTSSLMNHQEEHEKKHPHEAEVQEEDDDDGIDEDDLCCVQDSSAGFFACCRSTNQAERQGHKRLSDQDLEFGTTSAHGLTTMAQEHEKRSLYGQKNKRSLVLRQRTVLLATGNYGILAMAYILFDETIPLFLKLSKNYGGLEFTSSQIGFLLSISGGAMLGFNYYLLPYVISRTSKKAMYEWGIIGSIPFALLWPVLALINSQLLIPHIHNHTSYVSILWPVMILVCIMKNVFACLSFTAVMLQINHSVYEEYLGAVNGLGQSLASLARAFGPALGGLLWSVSIQQKFVFLNFLSVVAILAVSAVINRLLPDSIDHKKKKKRKAGAEGTETEEDHSGGGGMMMH